MELDPKSGIWDLVGELVLMLRVVETFKNWFLVHFTFKLRIALKYDHY